MMANKGEQHTGGRGGIRTHGTLAGTPVFKTGALNHSATLPTLRYQALSDRKIKNSPVNRSNLDQSWTNLAIWTREKLAAGASIAFDRDVSAFFDRVLDEPERFTRMVDAARRARSSSCRLRRICALYALAWIVIGDGLHWHSIATLAIWGMRLVIQ